MRGPRQSEHRLEACATKSKTIFGFRFSAGEAGKAGVQHFSLGNGKEIEFPLTLALSPIGGEGIDEGVNRAPIFLYRPLHRLGACAAVNTQKQGLGGNSITGRKPVPPSQKRFSVFGGGGRKSGG